MKRNALKVLVAGSTVALLAVPVLAQQKLPQQNGADRQSLDDRMPSNKPDAAPPGTDKLVPTERPNDHAAPKSVTFREGQQAEELPSLDGMPVNSSDGEPLGTIRDLVIDKNGKVSTVVVSVGGFLGIGAKNVGVPYDALQFATDTKNGKRIAYLSASRETLKKAPDYKIAPNAAVEMRAPGKSSELEQKPAVSKTQ